MQISPFEVYCTFLSLKQHFTNETYDYNKYNGKVNAKLETFYKRKDRYFYEKLSRNKSKKEVFDYFLANFVNAQEPNKLWIGDLKGEQGQEIYLSWLSKTQALSYTFSSDLRKIIEYNHFFESIKSEKNKHPFILKEFLKNNISIETLVILDSLLNLTQLWDANLFYDPIWQSLKLKIKKYNSFLDFDKQKMLSIFKEIVM